MVQKVFNLLNKEFEKLHEAAILIGLFAIGSQVLALVRDRSFTHTFGAGRDLDIYYAAFQIPDLLYTGIASLISATVLIPLLLKKSAEAESAVKDFLNSIVAGFLWAMVAVSTVVFFALPYISDILFGGFSPEQRVDVAHLSRILLLSPILLGLSNIFGSVAQARRRFMMYALAPMLYNMSIIGGIFLLYPFFGMEGIVWGVVLGACLHVLIQVPVVLREGMFPKLFAIPRMAFLREVVLLSFPRTISLSVHQFTIFILVLFASYMTEGSVSIFNFSMNLQSVPLSIIGVSYSVAVFPLLSRLFTMKDMTNFIANISISARHIIFWSLPVAVLLVVLRAQIVRTVFGSGAFTWDDTMLTAAALALFTVSLTAQCLVLLFMRGYYATGNTIKPLMINMFSMGVVALCAYELTNIFYHTPSFQNIMETLLRVSGVAGTEALMLPLAYSVGISLNALLFAFFFKRDFGTKDLLLTRTLLQVSLASAVLGLTAYYLLSIFDDVFNITTGVGIFAQGLFAGIAGILAGIIVLRLLDNEEARDISKALHSRFWKTKVILPEKEDL